jgi:hypothetical protein
MNTAVANYLSNSPPYVRHISGATVVGLSILLGILAGPEFLMMTVAGACLSWLIETELTRLESPVKCAVN